MKKKNIIFLIIILLTFLLVIYSRINPLYAPVSDNEFGDKRIIGVINKDTTLTQKFTSTIDTLDSVELTYSTYERENKNGSMVIELFDDNNNKLYYEKYDVSKIKDNSYIRLEFDPQYNSKGKEYTIVVNFEGLTSDEIITFWAVADRDPDLQSTNKVKVNDAIRVYQYGDSKSYFYTFVFIIILLIELFIAAFKYFRNKEYYKVKTRYKLLYNLGILIISLLFAYSLVDISYDLYYDGNMPTVWFPVFIITAMILVINIAYNISVKNIKLERLFLAIAMPLGALYLIALIPGNIPDEPYHYSMAYQLTQGNFLQKDNKSLQDGKIVYLDYEYAKKHLDKENDSYQTFYFGNGGYNPLMYIFSAIGIKIGQIFNLSILGTKYLGSFFNYLLFLISGFFIIKMLPYGKFAGFVYLFSPMNLQQMTSLSCDAVINSSCLLFIAYILNLRSSKDKLTIKNIIIISILLLFVLVCKNAYFPLALLLLLLKNNIKKSDNKTKKVCIIMFLSTILIFGGMYIYNKYNDGGLNDNVKITSVIQQENVEVPQTKYTKISYLMKNPIKGIYILFNTLKINADFHISSYVGKYLGSLNIEVPSFIVTFYLLLLVISIFFDSKDNDLDKKSKIILFISELLLIAIPWVAMFLWWGGTRDPFIEGIQGRYFIPSLILTIFIIGNKKLKLDINNKELLITIILLFINLWSILTVINFYLVR